MEVYNDIFSFYFVFISQIESIFEGFLKDMGILIITILVIIIFFILKRTVLLSVTQDNNASNKYVSFLKSIPYFISVHNSVLNSKEPYWRFYETRTKFLKKVTEQYKNNLLFYFVDDEGIEIDEKIKDTNIVRMVKDFENNKKKIVMFLIRRYENKEIDYQSNEEKEDENLLVRRYIQKNIVSMKRRFWKNINSVEDLYCNNPLLYKECGEKKEYFCKKELKDWMYFYFLGRFEMLTGFCDFIYKIPILPEERIFYIVEFFKKDYEENINFIRNNINGFIKNSENSDDSSSNSTAHDENKVNKNEVNKNEEKEKASQGG